jgi:hypothetical protein
VAALAGLRRRTPLDERSPVKIETARSDTPIGGVCVAAHSGRLCALGFPNNGRHWSRRPPQVRRRRAAYERRSGRRAQPSSSLLRRRPRGDRHDRRGPRGTGSSAGYGASFARSRAAVRCPTATRPPPSVRRKRCARWAPRTEPIRHRSSFPVTA